MPPQSFCVRTGVQPTIGCMPEPARTDDGRHVIVNGRRWRATDPSIPEERRAELVRILMAWRREVRSTKGTAAEAVARSGVHAAKVALGERGTPPWWEQTEAERRGRWQAHVAWPDEDASGSA